MTERTKPARREEEFVPLKPPIFMILLVLAEHPCHGYELAREIRQRSDGQIRLETGPLYRHLKRLLKDGLIEESDERPATDGDDERRRYYRVSNLGRRVLAAEAHRLGRLVDRIRQMDPEAQARR